MTPQNESPVPRSRRDLRTPAPAAQPSRQRVRSARKRGALTAFSIVAAVGFAAAYIAPTVSALGKEDSASAATPETMTAYDQAIAGAQVFSVQEDAVQADVTRDGYTVYVTPTPTPEPEPESASTASVPVMLYTGGGSAADWMAAAGISASDQGYVDYIVSKESGWNPNATNSSSGACGLVQIYPCSKVSNGYDPVVNLTWANSYAVGRYGSWAGAYSFWVSNNWW